MKYVSLRTSAYVNGVLRHPPEGALHLEDSEAERLVKDEVADDVSADFEAIPAADEAPVEHITTEDAKPVTGKRVASKES